MMIDDVTLVHQGVQLSHSQILWTPVETPVIYSSCS